MFKSLVFLTLILLINNCAKEKELENSLIIENDIEQQMIKSYEEGIDLLDNKLYLEAAEKFNDAETFFPQSDWAPRASLMAAYSFYIDDFNNKAISQLNSFLNKYPNHPRTSYAYYLLAMSNYNKIVDEKKDLEPLIESKNQFEYIVKNFSDTDFALDAKFKLDLINEMIASKEMYIARYYIKKGKWIPAINRLKFIIKEYDNTVFVEEALHRLVEIYYKMGLLEESKKYAVALGYNYPDSKWYKNSYKVLNKDYKIPEIKKTNKKNIIKKFKSLIN